MKTIRSLNVVIIRMLKLPNKKAKQRKMERRKRHEAIKKWKRSIKLARKKEKKNAEQK